MSEKSGDKPAKRKPGPRRQYNYVTEKQGGGPLLASRVEPEAYEWAKGRPEGTRKFLERIILKDKAEVLAAGATEPEEPPPKAKRKARSSSKT